MTIELENKINSAIKLLQSVQSATNKEIELSYSGGKDSDVILKLAEMSNIKYRPIYKNTTIDPPGTIAHVKSKDVEIIQPKQTFLQIIANKGMPTRRARFCCSILKEYKILDISIQGIRRNESVKRMKYYQEDGYIVCRNYGAKKNHVDVILPILNWTNNDVKEFIDEFQIQYHPLYKDEKGNFDPTKRLGCIGCPLQSDQGCSDYRQYPKLFKKVVNSVLIWWQNHPNTKSREKFIDPYGLIAHNIYYRSYNDWYNDTFTLFGITDWKQYMEKYFEIKLP